MIDASHDGRLDPVALGQAIAVSVGRDGVLANRVAPVLADAARTSPLVAHRLSSAIEVALPTLLASDARNTHLFLEVLDDGRSLLGHAVAQASARDALAEAAGRAGKGRVSIEARRLLALTEATQPPEARATAIREAIDGRMARVAHQPLASPAT